MQEGVGTNRYSYSFNDPVNGRDPSGHVIETPWDAFNVALGVVSLGGNISTGNYWGAALDVAGVAYDAVATSAPSVPGGASSAISIGRIAKAANATYNQANKFKKTFQTSAISQSTRRIATKVQNDLDHLTTKDILGAVGDILGNPVKTGAKTWDHLDEVSNALNGLKNQANSIKSKVLNRNDLTEAQRKAAEELLSQTSAQIDRVEKALDTAKEVAEKAKDLLK